ncbi:MAG TPA: zf-HC2 domain-containing protein [Acidobacteriota bacterium]|nr:zf-HC2 domain-containing protein [Acidobacteriota bacterium]
MRYNNMSECKWIRKRLSEYIDAELSQESRLRVHTHLSSCETCSKELDSLCKSISLISEYDSEQMPEGIRTFHLPRSSFIEVFPSIREEKPTLTSGILVPYLSACVLFLMVITATITFQHHFLPAADPQYNPSNFVQVFGE